MGVVYKLKEEVIDFILEQKKYDPAISVRRLASVAAAKFQIEISKSSINTILKNANLSSMVGRRSAASKAPKKFTIPTEKKKQLSAQVFQLSGQEEQAVKELPVVPEKPSLVQPAKKEEVPPAPALPVINNSEIVPIIPAATKPIVTQEVVEKENLTSPSVFKQSFIDEIVYRRFEHRAQYGQAYKGMGCVFLKAAQWEVFSFRRFDELLRRYSQGALPEDFSEQCSHLVYLNILAQQNCNNIKEYRGYGLPVLNESTGSVPDEAAFQALIEMPFRIPSLVSDYLALKAENRLWVSYFKLLLEDGTSLILDGCLLSFWPDERAIPNFLSWPVDKATTLLSRDLVSNAEGLKLFFTGQEASFSTEFFKAVGFLENLKNFHVKEIIGCDAQGQKIIALTTIPRLKRNYIVGIWPRQKEFAELTKSLRFAAKKPFYEKSVDKAVYYTETRTDFFVSRIDETLIGKRIITLWFEETQEPAVSILTNCETVAAEKITSLFLRRWPNWESKGVLFNRDEGASQISDDKKDRDTSLNNLWAVISDYAQGLEKHICANYLPLNMDKERQRQTLRAIYQLEGGVKAGKRDFAVLLKTEEDFAYKETLACMQKAVNESCVLDERGRQLIIEIC